MKYNFFFADVETWLDNSPIMISHQKSINKFFLSVEIIFFGYEIIQKYFFIYQIPTLVLIEITPNIASQITAQNQKLIRV